MSAAHPLLLLGALAGAPGSGAALAVESPFLAVNELIAGRPGRWLCRQVYAHPRGSMSVARSVEDRGLTVAESLHWNVIESDRRIFQAHWEFPEASTRRRVAKGLSGEIPLSGPPGGLVRVKLFVDGKVLHLSAPTRTDLQTDSGQLVLSFRYEGANGFPDIHGRKSLAFLAVEEEGRKLGALTVALPPWKPFDRQVDRARRDLAAAAWQAKAPCERLFDPPLHPPGY